MCPSEPSLKPAFCFPNRMLALCQSLNGQEPGVMSRVSILTSRISQANDQMHFVHAIDRDCRFTTGLGVPGFNPPRRLAPVLRGTNLLLLFFSRFLLSRFLLT